MTATADFLKEKQWIYDSKHQFVIAASRDTEKAVFKGKSDKFSDSQEQPLIQSRFVQKNSKILS